MTSDTQTETTATATAPNVAPGPMSRDEFNALVATLSQKYGPNVALKMARRKRLARHPLHKTATARRVEMADTAIEMTGTFHSL